MSDDDDHVDVEIKEAEKTEKDEPKVEVVEETSAKKEDSSGSSVDEGISELKRKLDAEKRAREEAERRAYDAQKQAHQSNFDAKRADLQSVESALEIIKSRDESLKRAYAEAHASGDSDRIAEIVQAMTVNEEQKKDLKKGKKELKRQIEAAERQPVHPVPPPQVDMVEQIAQSVSPRSAAWIREAKDHLKDERSVRKMFRAHEDAVEDGITPDTDEYFAFIEGRLGINRQQQQEVESPMSSAAAPTPRRSSPPPAAPVSRQSTPSNVMRLTRSEIDTARDLGMTPEEYAKNKSLLIKEKRYGN
jgi:hypothetical protein